MSHGTIASTSDAEKLRVLDAVERAKALKLCLRRIWAVAASLPGRENSLPGLIPVPGTFHVPGHDRERHEHEQCTFDFCEQSRVDFTSVAQHHETPCDGNCEQITFPLEQLKERVRNGEPTAWRLDEPSLLNASHPYMAVSHVWSDGTGSGIWGPGKVNKCLYTFFSSIARSFQCEGCWWDTISIPLDDEARAKALGRMHINYNSSRITLVHDLYLREWEWVDPETACFAIVMSPWYSRGWTALELAQSHKVKILFKAQNDSYMIKDLDVDILANVSKNHPTAESIRKLRHTSIDEFGALLAILGARDTSKPRDVPIISGLLAGVDVSGGLSQQEIYQRILRKLREVAQGNLFHNSATMSAPGFSWCPTNILDMPMAEKNSPSAMLKLGENGDLEGYWRVQAIDSVKVEDLITRGTHPLTQVSLESAFRGEHKEKHVLLLETDEPEATSNNRRALLVRLKSTDEISAQFVGPVYFRAPAESGTQNSVKLPQIKVRIGSTVGLEDVSGKAWDYVQRRVTENDLAMGKTSATGRSDDGACQRNSKDWKAILFTEGVPVPSWLEKASQPEASKSKSQDEMSMILYHHRSQYSKQPAFFYGNEGMVESVSKWLNKDSNLANIAGQLVFLGHGEGSEINVSKEDDDARNLLAAEALLLATKNSNKGDNDMTALINLLLEKKAPHRPDASGQTPLNIALEGRNSRIAEILVETLLPNESSPVDVDAKVGKTKQTALQLAAKCLEMKTAVYERLVDKSKNVDAQDEPHRRTALHYAAEKGNLDMAKALLKRGAHPNIPDSEDQVPLHLAASKGSDEIVRLLLEHAKIPKSGSDSKEAVKHHDVPSEHTNKTTGGDTKEVTENDRKNQAGFQTHDKVDGTVTGVGVTSSESIAHPERRKYEEPSDVKDGQKQTPLHLAAAAGHISVVSTLLKSRANPFAVASNGQTPLKLAVEGGHLEVVKTLLLEFNKDSLQQALDEALLLAAVKNKWKVFDDLQRKGARSNGLVVSWGMTALHWTIRVGHYDRAESLIGTLGEDIANVDVTDEINKRSALLMASEAGMYNVVKQLLKKGADIRLTDSGKRTALHLAAKGPWPLTVGELLENKNCSVIAQDEDGRTALEIAAEEGHRAVVERLHPKTKEPDLKQRAVQLAAKAGHLSVALLLHERIEDDTTKASTSRTILFAAVAVAKTEKDKALFKELLSKVRDPNIQDNEGRSLLMLAIESHQPGLANHLLTNPLFSDRLKNDLTDNKGYTALHHAVENRCFDTFKELLRFDSDTFKTTLGIQDCQKRNALHLAVAQNSEKMVRELLPQPVDKSLVQTMDTKDVEGQTPLLLAAAKGHAPLVTWMLSCRFEPNTQDKNGQTPLLLTAEGGDNVSVKALLENGADPNLRDKHGRTALSQAARNGHQDVVGSLLGHRDSHKTNLNARDNMGRTALILAAENGHVEIVKLLVEERANKDVVGYDGKKAWQKAVDKWHTPVVQKLLSNENAPIQDRQAMNEALLLASKRGWVDLVTVLLEKEADLTFQSSADQRTALHMAAMGGHEEVLKMSLDKSVGIAIKDHDGHTALFKATEQGFESIVGLLLERNEIRDNIDAWMGQESLFFAAEKGYDGIVKKLLKSGVNINATDASGRTAMVLAAANGKEAIVNMLLEKEATWTARDKYKRTALHYAAWGGHHKIIKTLLVCRPTGSDGGGDVGLSALDNRGQSALHLAAERASIKAVEELLNKRPNVNAKCKDGQTVLHRAAWGGSCEVVTLLRNSGADPFIRDNDGKQPWHIAAEKGHEEIVLELLSQEKAVYDERILDQKGLIFAAKMGYTSIARCLLTKKAEATVKDEYGRTPLHWAAARGNKELTKLLIDKYEASINAVDRQKHTALCLAVLDDRTATVEILLKSHVDADIPDKEGQTALHHAAQRGNEEIAQILVDHNADPHIQDKTRRKAWQLAAEKGHYQVVRLLLKKQIALSPHNQRKEELFLRMSAQNSVSMVQLLLELKVDINVKDSFGRTAIGLAAEHDANDVLRLLLSKGADPNIADPRGQTPLLWAAKAGNLKIISMLLEKVTSKSYAGNGTETINRKDAEGKTALVIAIENEHDKAVKLLLNKSKNQSRNLIDVNVQDEMQRTALHQAAEMGKANWVEHLLGSKAEQGHKDKLGRTPLLLAAEQGHTEVVKTLLGLTKEHANNRAKRADKPDKYVNDADNQARTPLQAATDRGNEDMVKALLEAGADPNARDARGRTALLLAAEHGEKTILGLLLDKNEAQKYAGEDHRIPALRVAVANGDKAIVQALLHRPGADCIAHGKDLLQLAVQSGNKEVVWLVVEMQVKTTMKQNENGGVSKFSY